MNRKKAIISMFLLGSGFIATYSGYRWYHINKIPDFSFLNGHKAMIADLAEIIIPRTNTPGAKDVMAQDTILTLLKNASDRKTQNNFIDGLKDVEHFSINKFEKKFTELSVTEQKSIVKHFFEKGKIFSGNLGKAENKLLGKSFFEILKQYSTIAFCTSMQGATEALAFDYIPGRYIGCIPLMPNQRAWATK